MKYLTTYKLFESLDGEYRLTVFALDRDSSEHQARTIKFKTVDEFNKLMKEYEDDIEYRKFYFDFDMIDEPEYKNSPRTLQDKMNRVRTEELQKAMDEWV